jgi:transposase
MKNPWSQAEEDRLEALRLDGNSAAAIAQMLGRTQSSVENRCHVLAVRKPAMREAAVLALVQEQWTYRVVMQLLGIRRATIKTMIWRLRRKGHTIPHATRTV